MYKRFLGIFMTLVISHMFIFSFIYNVEAVEVRDLNVKELNVKNLSYIRSHLSDIKSNIKSNILNEHEVYVTTNGNKHIKEEFVDVKEIIPTAVIDIKYATTDNFTKTKLYDNSQALLRRGTAEKLKKVADEMI